LGRHSVRLAMSQKTMSRSEQDNLRAMLSRRAPRLVVAKERDTEVAVDAESMRQAVFVDQCQVSKVIITGQSAQITLQGCTDCTFSLKAAIVASLDVVDCHNCSVELEDECSTIVLDKSTDVTVSLPDSRLPAGARVFTAHCAGVSLGPPGGQGAYTIEEDNAPVMGQRWRLLTKWDADSGLYRTERCDLFGSVTSASRASTREPSPVRGPGPTSALGAVDESAEDDDV